MKTIIQALIDEVHYPIPYGFVENKCIERSLSIDSEYTIDVAKSDAFRGALADCLYSLVHAVNFSESDKSIGNLSDAQRKIILKRANSLYLTIGEEEKECDEPKVYWGS